MDAVLFLTDFRDHLAPRLDPFEPAIYLHAVRHSRLVEQDEVVIGFKSAAARIATSYRGNGQPIDVGTCYVKLRSLQEKGCLKIITVEEKGTRIRVYLPREIAGVIPLETVQPMISLEDMDFFSVEENRQFILVRERRRCFYCLRALTAENHVIEHVVSRPARDNSYRNVVAACRQCNNRKGDSDAEGFLRVLYREEFLSADEFEQRLSHLQPLRAGELLPVVPSPTLAKPS